MLKKWLINLFINAGKKGQSTNCATVFYQPSLPEELKK